MRAVVQRVQSAGVAVAGETVGSIGQGLLVYLGIAADDSETDFEYIANKIPHLRVFDDENAVPNRSVLDVGGAVLLISQFTLYGDARHGRRPGYGAAAKPETARAFYESMAARLSETLPVQTGIFQADSHIVLSYSGCRQTAYIRIFKFFVINIPYP